MKLYGQCEMCKKPNFFVRKRKIKIPSGQIATSQKLMCGKCYKKIATYIEQQEKPL